MFLRLWRRVRDGSSKPLGHRSPAFRPHLDSLEDRLLPAPCANPLAGFATGAMAFARQTAASPEKAQSISPSQASPLQVDITVSVNAADQVVDLGKVLANWAGVAHGDTPSLTILRNSNPNLVTARLADTELTLTFATGQSGSATVTVGARDASGTPTQVIVSITVQPSPGPVAARLPSSAITTIGGTPATPSAV